MAHQEEDYSHIDFSEQQDEVEALQSIFVDEFKLIDEKPYKFESPPRTTSSS